VFAPSGTIVAQATAPVVVGIVVILAIAVRMGQAGSRLPVRSPVPTSSASAASTPSASDPTVVNRDDDRLWVGGLIYVNRRDPGILVPKRYAVGWTLNFGNPKAWLVFVIVAAGLTALAVARRR
jgi:uncharacterized membrane protein